MKTFVVNEETASIPIGDLLRQAQGETISLLNAEGQPIGWIGPPSEPLPPLTEEELGEIRRLSRSDRSNDMTTSELLARLHALAAGE